MSRSVFGNAAVSSGYLNPNKESSMRTWRSACLPQGGAVEPWISQREKSPGDTGGCQLNSQPSSLRPQM